MVQHDSAEGEPFVAPPARPPITDAEREQRAQAILAEARLRRSVRDFSDRPVPQSIIECCLQVAGLAPSGANQQPWHFVAVQDPEKKREIRIAAEKEEYEFYHRRAPDAWLNALQPIGTNEQKPFLEVAPWLVAIFAQTYGQEAGQTTSTDSADSADSDNSATQERVKHYYVAESVGIATGMLITALNQCGLATLTHTPSPMKFLNQILGRPSNERPFLLLVVGFPTENCQVPNLTKKSLEQLATFL